LAWRGVLMLGLVRARAGTLCDVTDEEQHQRDSADSERFLIDLFLQRASPRQLLGRLVERLHETPEPDPERCLDVGCGDLETLLRDHETELWPEVEGLARSDIRFRRALAAVWAYDSERYEARTALLDELGERREITVRFTVAPEDFSSDPELSWRAFDSEGSISKDRLAEVLRRLADWLDQRES